MRFCNAYGRGKLISDVSRKKDINTDIKVQVINMTYTMWILY